MEMYYDLNKEDYTLYVEMCKGYAQSYINAIFSEILDGDWAVEEIINYSTEQTEFIEYDNFDAYFNSTDSLYGDGTMVFSSDSELAKQLMLEAVEKELIEKMIDYIDDKFYLADRGSELNLVVNQETELSGADVVVAVSLNEDKEIAYHYETDEYNTNWQIGNSDDVIDFWLETAKEKQP